MIEYRMMDETCLLCYGLHGGPIPVEETRTPEARPIAAESENGVRQGTIAEFLRAVCRAYGSCAVLAIDRNHVIGKLRFYPQKLVDMLEPGPCLQTPDHVRGIAAFDLESLPPKDSLSEKVLRIWCFQVLNDYKAMAEGRPQRWPSYLRRGIGTTMLKKLIEWSRAEGWDEIHATAIPHIRPLMAWSAALSVERYRKLGFEVTLSANRDQAGPVSQRRGAHGEVIKKMWEPYAHVSDEEASRLYDVALDLKKEV